MVQLCPWAHMGWPVPNGTLSHSAVRLRRVNVAVLCGTMTDLAPDTSKESDIPLSLEPIAPTLARRPHRQLTPNRLHDFATNPLQLIDKAFLLIVPDLCSTLGKLFLGDKKANEMGLDRMMEVLEGGYEIDSPPADPNAGPQGVGLAGRVFGALRSFTGF
ncbi:hypothetical protein EV424DRAFT_1602538 [Suillus variegatus]|nr:hypothetical protein EV424DRAFT_1602538 [Suillus variegatus]